MAIIIAILGLAGSVWGNSFTTQFSPTRISWNPQHAYTTTEAQIFTALYEGLTAFHPVTLETVPGAAEEWTVSEDELSIAFTLRENLVWSNGDPVTSMDFKNSWLTLLAPDSGTEYASLLDDIAGAHEYRTGKGPLNGIGVHAPDNRTLVVELKYPSPQFLSILCHYTFVPVHKDFLGKENWNDMTKVPVNGPFVVMEQSKNRLILEKNPLYWDKDHVSVETLQLLFEEDSKIAMEKFNRFEIDWVASGMDAPALGIPDALNISPLFSTTYYYFNNKKKPWDNENVRRALALLVPWDEIQEDFLIPATSLVPPIPDYPAVTIGLPSIEERKIEALKLLEEAGFPQGKGLPTLITQIPTEDKSLNTIVDAWETAINLEVQFEIVPFPDYYDSIKEGGYDLATLTWTGDYADPYTFLGMWTSTSSFNEAGFSNKRYDELLQEASRLPHKKRLVKMSEAEDILLRSAQVLPMEHFPAVNIIDLRFIDGWSPNVLDIHPFKNIIPRMGFAIPGVAMAP